MKSLLPAIGIVEATEPATYLITPFQDAAQAYSRFLDQARARLRIMIYGFTLAWVADLLVTKKRAGVDVKLILDHSQAVGHCEAPVLQRLVAGGFVDGVDFLIGTSPDHHAINHLKATWIDEAYVWHGSWNYSLSANQQLNSIEIIASPELARTFDRVFTWSWDWVKTHEAGYQTLSGPGPGQ